MKVSPDWNYIRIWVYKIDVTKKTMEEIFKRVKLQ